MGYKDLDEIKGKVLRKLWKEREKEIKKSKEEKRIEMG